MCLCKRECARALNGCCKRYAHSCAYDDAQAVYSYISVGAHAPLGKDVTSTSETDRPNRHDSESSESSEGAREQMIFCIRSAVARPSGKSAAAARQICFTNSLFLIILLE